MVFSNLKARSCLIRKAPREQHLPDVSAKNVTGSHCFYIVLHFLIPWNIEACSLQSECGSLSVSFLKVASQEEFQGGSFSLTSSSCESIKSDNGTCGPMSSQYKSMAAGMTTKTSSGHVMYTSKTIGQIGSGFFESSRNRSWMNSTLGGSYWTGLSLPSTWGSSLHTFGSRTVPNNSLDSTPSKKPWEPNLKPPGKKMWHLIRQHGQGPKPCCGHRSHLGLLFQELLRLCRQFQVPSAAVAQVTDLRWLGLVRVPPQMWQQCSIHGQEARGKMGIRKSKLQTPLELLLRSYKNGWFQRI